MKEKANLDEVSEFNNKYATHQLIAMSLVSPIVAFFVTTYITSNKISAPAYFSIAIVLLINGIWSFLVSGMLWNVAKKLNQRKYSYMYYLAGLNVASVITPFLVFANR